MYCGQRQGTLAWNSLRHKVHLPKPKSSDFSELFLFIHSVYGGLSAMVNKMLRHLPWGHLRTPWWSTSDHMPAFGATVGRGP